MKSLTCTKSLPYSLNQNLSLNPAIVIFLGPSDGRAGIKEALAASNIARTFFRTASVHGALPPKIAAFSAKYFAARKNIMTCCTVPVMRAQRPVSCDVSVCDLVGGWPYDITGTRMRIMHLK